MQPGLYIVGTPIGNLQDVTLRALDALRDADLVLAEDTRHTRKLLSRHGLTASLTSCHRFNEASRRDMVIRKIRDEAFAVALVSNAGMPAVSDPGNRLVTACREAGLHVEVVPGPSAVTAAVALSGMGENGFNFEGFLSPKSAARKRRLAELAQNKVPVVLFESPHRAQKLLDEIDEVLGDREIFVAREMTKKFEESLSGTAAEVRSALGPGGAKGEFVFLIAPAARKRNRASAEGPGD